MVSDLKYLAFLTACFYSFNTAAAVNIAVIMPISGSHKVIGTEILSGAEIAVEEINKSGGLLGEKINFIPVEDTCNDGLTVSTAEMIALNNNKDTKISAVIGPYCLNQFPRVTATYAKAGVFQIIPKAISSAYASYKQNGLIKLVGYQDQQAKDFYAYYKQNFKGLRVGVIYDDAHISVAQALQKEFIDDNSSEDIRLYHFESKKFNYNKIAKKNLSSKTQIAFILGKAEPVSKMAKALKSRKRKYVIFVNKYQVMPDFNSIMGDLADKCYFMSLPTLKDSPEFAETLVQLRLHGVEPEGMAVYGYSAVRLWADLAQRAHSFDYHKLSQALNNYQISTGWGKLMYINGAPSQSLKYSIFYRHNEEYTQVY